MDEFFETVGNLYAKSNYSVNEISRKLNLSPQKVRKILITLGLFSSPMSEAVFELWVKDVSVDEIAKELNISTNAAHSYVPYVKTIYNSEHPSKNAIRIRKCRLNKKARTTK